MPGINPTNPSPAGYREYRAIILWLFAGILTAVISRWIGRRIPLDWPVGIRLVLSGGCLLGVFVSAAGLRDRLGNALQWLLERRPPIRSTGIIVVLSVVITGGILLMKTTSLVQQDEPGGDEPEYLMLTRSLIDDKDFELQVDAATGVCREFMNDRFNLPCRSVRPPGLPVMLIPAFLAGRHLPWPGLPHTVYLFMGMLYVFLGAQLFLTIQAVTDRPRLAVAATLTATLTPPLLTYAFHVYPEIPAAGLILYLFRREFYGDPDRDRRVDGILLALIPLLHQKYLFLFVVSLSHLLTGVWVYRRKHAGSWMAILVSSAISFACLCVFFGRRFGVWLPTAPYVLNEGLLSNVLTRRTLRAVLGQFLDRKWGLFMINPLLMFSIPGIYAVWRRRPWMWLWWFALTGGFVVLVSAYPMWWGGFCPAGRFVLPVVPLLWVGAARMLVCFPSKHVTVPSSGQHTKRCEEVPPSRGESLSQASAACRSCASFVTVTLVLQLVIAGYFSWLMVAGSPFKTQNASPYQYPEESPNGSSLWAAVSTTVDWNRVFPAIERNGKWNHILPDELQFNTRNAAELAGFAGLVLLWSLLVIRFSQPRSTSIRDRTYWIIPVLFLSSGLGFFLPGNDNHELLIRQRLQRVLNDTHDVSRLGTPVDGFVDLPGVYGSNDGSWHRAPDPKFDIFYPPIYIQDMPDEFWPGGFTYRFSVPIRWLPATDCGKIGLSVENLLTKHKHVAEMTFERGAGETMLEVLCPVDPGHQAMFKIILYGDTSQYEYRVLRVAVRGSKGTQVE